jgi:TetR/AcrR family transcriptional repressor of nem operon
VCDLSEDMRTAMDKGASGVIALLAQALAKGREENQRAFERHGTARNFSLQVGA